MIPCAARSAPAFDAAIAVWPGVDNSRTNTVADRRLGGRIRRVVDDEPAFAEHPLHPSSERLGHAGARLVGGAEIGQQRVAKLGGRQRLFELGESGGDVIVEGDGRDRHRIARRALGQGDRPGLEVAGEDGARTHFVPVVVFGFDPEDRHGGHPVPPRDLVGELERRDGFEQRVDRPAEEARLLAGQHRDGCRVAETIGRRAGLRRRAAAPLLLADGPRQLLTIARMRLGAGDRGRPRRVVFGIARENGARPPKAKA